MFLGHLGEMVAAVQSLLLACHRQKNNRRRKFQLAQNPRAFEANGRPAAVVVRPRSIPLPVEHVAVARIVVPGHEHDAFRIFRIGTLQDRINIGDFGGLWNPVGGRFGKAVGFHLQASAALLRVALEFRLDPLARRANPASRCDRSRILRRERRPRSKARQLLNTRPNTLCRHLLERGRHAAVDLRRFRPRRAWVLRRRRAANGQQQGDSRNPWPFPERRNHVGSGIRNVKGPGWLRPGKKFGLSSPGPLTFSG